MSGQKMYDLDSEEFKDFKEVMGKLQKNLETIANSPAAQMSKTISQLADSLFKPNQEILKKLVDSMPKFSLPSTTLYIPPPRTHIVPKVEFSGSSELVVEQPAVKHKKRQRQKMGFGLYFIAGNSVQFKRKTLKAISLETQHGKLLEMFLLADGHFVADDDLLEAFNKHTVYELSHILRNLRNAFRANDLIIRIERRKIAKGYALIDIQKDKVTD